ncbi:MAG: acyl carrier protein [Deltaproteobacteria bacterium]|nr:acyl carrier protein [Deltaproteobacteria bacterium]
MTKEAVLEVVTENLIDTLDDEIEAKDVDASKSMKDLGANSLDIVEVVSSSMRQLKVKVPRSELSKLTNIQELVDVLYQAGIDKDQEQEQQAKAS